MTGEEVWSHLQTGEETEIREGVELTLPPTFLSIQLDSQPLSILSFTPSPPPPHYVYLSPCETWQPREQGSGGVGGLLEENQGSSGVPSSGGAQGFAGVTEHVCLGVTHVRLSDYTWSRNTSGGGWARLSHAPQSAQPLPGRRSPSAQLKVRVEVRAGRVPAPAAPLCEPDPAARGGSATTEHSALCRPLVRTAAACPSKA